MNGFWGGRCEKSYVDVKIFNPHAPTNRSSASRSIYRHHKNVKKCAYMKLEFVGLSMAPLLLLSSLQRLGWLIKPLCFTNI